MTGSEFANTREWMNTGKSRDTLSSEVSPTVLNGRKQHFVSSSSLEYVPIPNVKISYKKKEISLVDVVANKRCLFLGCPGAFIPDSSETMLSGFIQRINILKRFFDHILCIAVNDHFVLKAWAKHLKAPKSILFISDWGALMTRSLGLGWLDDTGTLRCRPFALITEDTTVQWCGLDEDASVEKLLDKARSLYKEELRVDIQKDRFTVSEYQRTKECSEHKQHDDSTPRAISSIERTYSDTRARSRCMLSSAASSFEHSQNRSLAVQQSMRMNELMAENLQKNFEREALAESVADLQQQIKRLVNSRERSDEDTVVLQSSSMLSASTSRTCFNSEEDEEILNAAIDTALEDMLDSNSQVQTVDRSCRQASTMPSTSNRKGA